VAAAAASTTGTTSAYSMARGVGRAVAAAALAASIHGVDGDVGFEERQRRGARSRSTCSRSTSVDGASQSAMDLVSSHNLLIDGFAGAAGTRKR
jgi:hypothetical protein